jgi:Glyoxalase-like domain
MLRLCTRNAEPEMPAVHLDHLVIAAATLEAAVAWAAERLGVAIPPGGSHERMGTHNAVLPLGSDLGPDIYLEIIAINAAAQPPTRARWFGLDDPAMRKRLASEGPQLITWVVRSDDLAATVASSSVALGVIHPMSRGAIHWQITIRDDGSLPLGGLVPVAIEWPPGPHVSTRMTDAGLRLAGLRLAHPNHTELEAALQSIDARRFVTIDPIAAGAASRLSAEFIRPDGHSVVVG